MLKPENGEGYSEYFTDADVRPGPATPVRESLARLEEAVTGIQDNEGFRRYLDAQARFHSYSWGNVLLILSQRPHATRVAGYRTWQALGRQVRRGEKGIRILVPLGVRHAPHDHEQVQKNDQEQPEESPPSTSTSRARLLFGTGTIFDVSQTEGDPLPEVEVPILGGHEGRELYGRLARIAEREELSIEVSPDELGGGAMGYYAPAQNRIVLREAAPLQMTKTLAHELAHHFDRATCSSAQSETVAEAVAYVVCARHGLDTGARSFPYIATWSRERDALKAALGRIQSLSSLLIADTEVIELE